MLALLFDMNSLWEEYVLVRLKQVQDDYGVQISGQQSTSFWDGIRIRPDIVIEKDEGKNKGTFIIDTKWKNISYNKPSTDDLRQMYVYNEYWKSDKAMLLYPSNLTSFEKKDFKAFDTIKGKDKHHACGLGKISIFKSANSELDEKIGEKIIQWFV